MHGTIPQDLLKHFEMLRICRNKFDCLLYKLLFIRTLKPNLNVQADYSCESIFIIFAPCYVNFHATLLALLAVMTTPKRQIYYIKLLLLSSSSSSLMSQVIVTVHLNAQKCTYNYRFAQIFNVVCLGWCCWNVVIFTESVHVLGAEQTDEKQGRVCSRLLTKANW